MIWYGRYNAILILILTVSVVVSFNMQTPLPFGYALGTVITVRIVASFANVLSKAFRGKPLIYDVQIIDKDEPHR